MADFLPNLPWIPGYVPAPDAPRNRPVTGENAGKLREIRKQLDTLLATLPAGALLLDIPGEGGGRTFGDAAGRVRDLTIPKLGDVSDELKIARQLMNARREMTAFQELIELTDFERLLRRPISTRPNTPVDVPETPVRPPTLPEGWQPGDLTPPNEGVRTPTVPELPLEPPVVRPSPPSGGGGGGRLLQGGLQSLPGIAKAAGRAAGAVLNVVGPFLDQYTLWQAYLDPLSNPWVKYSQPRAAQPTGPRSRGSRKKTPGRRPVPTRQARPSTSSAPRSTGQIVATSAPAIEADIWGEPVTQPAAFDRAARAGTGLSSPRRIGTDPNAGLRPATVPDLTWMTFALPQARTEPGRRTRAAAQPLRIPGSGSAPLPGAPGLEAPLTTPGGGIQAGTAPTPVSSLSPSPRSLTAPGGGGVDDICRARAAEDRRRRRKKQKSCESPKFITRKIRVCDKR